MSITIHTDGGNSLKNEIGGAAAVVSQNQMILAECVEAFQGPNVTNNTMELYAVILAGQYMLAHPELGRNVTIVSDSEYVVNGATKWLDNWKSKNWKTTTGPVKNRELWEAIDYLKTVLNITFQWTRGHSNNQLNNLADELAVKAYTRLIESKKSD